MCFLLCRRLNFNNLIKFWWKTENIVDCLTFSWNINIAVRFDYKLIIIDVRLDRLFGHCCHSWNAGLFLLFYILYFHVDQMKWCGKCTCWWWISIPHLSDINCKLVDEQRGQFEQKLNSLSHRMVLFSCV